jgi:ethanolamine utilization protein EutJ
MNIASLAETMARLEAVWDAGRPAEPPTAVKAGVDLGTTYSVLVVLDETDRPLAVACERADVVRDGVVTDFIGAIDVVRRLRREVEFRLEMPVEAAHGAYPPGVPLSEVRAVQHVIEGAHMDCTGLVDEPTAANAVLGLRDGVVVDVGGGTTGVAVVQDGQVVHTADEATGGTHLSLVIAGALGIPFEEAEALKQDPAEQPRLFRVVRPVMEKVATIVARNTQGWPVPQVCLVGGSVTFPRFAAVVSEVAGLDATVPVSPLFVTPLGIALSAPAREARYGSIHPRELSR